jgi:DNA-binding transcriptional ArsR family regulator
VDTYDALEALGDGTRRAVLESLRDGPKSVAEIARPLPVSRPAVSQHLKILKGAGLVVDEAEGTRRLYRLDPSGLGRLYHYIEDFWEQALTKFKQEVEMADAEQPRRRATRRPKTLRSR